MRGAKLKPRSSRQHEEKRRGIIGLIRGKKNRSTSQELRGQNHPVMWSLEDQKKLLAEGKGQVDSVFV